ncbi:hypothetical protein ACFPYJ_08590 [Paenibacillus solisilvae]|uniref:Uncharacterized protein n=1 Tax=Paenibacillus solisilvae TaxID=2486751 RepID=A0ABW0VYI5_9BACL
MYTKVPYGYEPPPEQEKGTLIYYDSFEHTTYEELDLAAEHAISHAFTKLVLYLIHEQTMKRMSAEPVSAYYKREKRLEEWIQARSGSLAGIDTWEGKRKKYAPIDSALRHLTETLPAPHFICVTPEMANFFASLSIFEDWISRIRLLLLSEPRSIHPRLDQYRNRWSTIG